MYSIMLPQASKVRNNVFHKLCWSRSYIMCFFKTTAFLMHVYNHMNHLASSFHIWLPPNSNVCKHKPNASSFHLNHVACYHPFPSKPVEGFSFANAPIKYNIRSSIKSMSWQINMLEVVYFATDENVPFSATVFMRDFISSHAFQTAWPYKCYLVEVVVGEAFWTLSVLVSEISSELKGLLNEVNRNLYNFGMQSVSHFNSTMCYKNTSICI